MTRDIEKYGSGIHRILESCETAGLPRPKFENFSGGFRIRFSSSEQPLKERGASNEGLNEGLKSLFTAIKENSGIQAKDLAENLHRPIKTVERQIKVLIDKGLIERRGSKKTGGYWIR